MVSVVIPQLHILRGVMSRFFMCTCGAGRSCASSPAYASSPSSNAAGRTPKRGTIRRRSAGPLQNPGLQRRSSFLHRSSGMMGVQARQPLSFEATLPATDIVGVAAQNLANRQVGPSLRQQQDQPRAAYILGRQCARPQPIPQFLALTRRQAKLRLMHASCYMSALPMSLLQATSFLPWFSPRSSGAGAGRSATTSEAGLPHEVL